MCDFFFSNEVKIYDLCALVSIRRSQLNRVRSLYILSVKTFISPEIATVTDQPFFHPTLEDE